MTATPTLLTVCASRLILSGRLADMAVPPARGVGYAPGMDAAPALAMLAGWLDREASNQPHLANHVTAILGQTKVRRRAPGKGLLAGWQKKKALELLGEHLAEPISIEAVAAACRLSRAHFTRAFGASVGMAPYRWRMDRRMTLARQRLADSNHTFAEVARACGFLKMSHFSHAFAQSVGMCPRRWRQAFGGRGALA